MELDRLPFERAPALVRQLVGRAEVDDVREREIVAKALHVLVGQRMERVASKQASPAKGLAVASRVAPEIPEVHAAVEVDGSVHGAGV